MNQADPGVKLDIGKLHGNDMGYILSNKHNGKPMSQHSRIFRTC